MRSRAALTMAALAASSVATWLAVVSCKPQDIYLFDRQPMRGQPDSGAYDPPLTVQPDLGFVPPEQPPCESAACQACVTEGACGALGALSLCHPQSGACAQRCDADDTSPQVRSCPAPQRCDPSRGLCVDCVENTDCNDGPLAICSRQLGSCVECVVPTDCSLALPVCDPSTSRCVECNSDQDCRVAGEVCLVARQTCVQCRDDDDCGGISGGPRCLSGEQLCVGCVSDADCSSIDPQRPRCSSSHECEDDNDD